MQSLVWRTVSGIMVVLAAALGQSSSRPPLSGGISANQDYCSGSAACYSPARGPQCPQVRFGWGDCPGSRKACDWCYGPDGVFAYAPRGSQYTLSSGCNQPGPNTTWATKDPQVAQWMRSAGGNCKSDPRAGYACGNVDPAQFKQAANCGNPGNPPAPTPPAPDPPSNSSALCSCETPARGPQCPQVRFGWGDCPGSRKACDWCYGQDGVFAYSPRGSQYTLSSGCNQLGKKTIWSTKDPQVVQAMKDAGGKCSSGVGGGYQCTNVDQARYQQAANCGQGCGVNAPGAGTNPPSPIAGTLPPTVFSSPGGASCQKVQFTYFYINGINTPDGPTSGQWRGTYASERDSVKVNLIDDLDTPPLQLDPPVPRAKGILQNIKVSSETDKMYGPRTHNPSGVDTGQRLQKWLETNCTGFRRVVNLRQCTVMYMVSQFVSGSSTAHMAPGDLFECLRQSIDFPGMPGIDIQATAQDATVQQVARAILDIYKQEQAGGSGTKNYFIVAGHSQGNFFVEAVAYYLGFQNPEGIGQEIYLNRLGLVSLASPTDYSKLDSVFQSSRIVHHTRSDDAINIVATLGKALRLAGISGKRSWSPNDPPLWPWPSPPDLFGFDQLVSGGFGKRLGFDSGVSPNPELYSPLMNSHLLENYLDIPAATKSGVKLKPEPSVVPWTTTQLVPAVLNCIRRDLYRLKANLISGSKNPVSTDCTDRAYF